jgi:hypothetical protein
MLIIVVGVLLNTTGMYEIEAHDIRAEPVQSMKRIDNIADRL